MFTSQYHFHLYLGHFGHLKGCSYILTARASNFGPFYCYFSHVLGYPSAVYSRDSNQHESNYYKGYGEVRISFCVLFTVYLKTNNRMNSVIYDNLVNLDNFSPQNKSCTWVCVCVDPINRINVLNVYSPFRHFSFILGPFTSGKGKIGNFIPKFTSSTSSIVIWQ